MKTTHLKDFKPYSENYCKFVKTGKIIRTCTLNRKNSKNFIQKISRDEYIVLRTGEIQKYKHIETRDESLNSVRQTISRLRDLINNNFFGGNNELWITLTYGENKVYEPSLLCKDFELFIKRLRYNYSKQKIDYIYVPEPHEKGDWHIHLLLKSNKKLVIPNNKLAEIWQNGFVKVNRLKDIDNVGAYVSAYLINIKEGETTKKGARLNLYPANHKLYRFSKGIVIPEVEKIKYSEVAVRTSGASLTYKETIQFETEQGFQNTIHYETYKFR